MKKSKILFGLFCLLLLVVSVSAITDECSDGIDNDGDGYIDISDYGCRSGSLWSEKGTADCDDGVDNDGDGLLDWPEDRGCLWVGSDTEENAQCGDNIDNDQDGYIDYPDDPQCFNRFDDREYPTSECDDGLDNDKDGRKDFPQDEGCLNQDDNDENNDLPRETNLYNLWENKLRISQGGYIGGKLDISKPLFDVFKDKSVVSSINYEGNYFVVVYGGQQTRSSYSVTIYSYDREGKPHELTSIEAALIHLGTGGATEIVQEAVNIQRNSEGEYTLKISRKNLYDDNSNYILDIHARGSGEMRQAISLPSAWTATHTVTTVIIVGSLLFFVLKKKGTKRSRKKK